jgi:hypothetical protein
MTVIRRANPLGKRIALRRVLDRKGQAPGRPAVPANGSLRNDADSVSTAGHRSPEKGA